MTLASRYIYSISFAIAATGFLLPFWPLSVLGVLIAALSGRYFFAIAMALLLDVGHGQATGLLHYFLVPFTILAVAATLARVFGGAYFLDKTPPDTL
ncbi:MAG TPA: hypothetical protein VGP13_02610 [Candidatus Paceibacterota bacterium]|jgi:hypothetical protein|nr:hypothetical protein [Candidatus Paceibacterota bacterium]